jgi:hypothetical protein
MQPTVSPPTASLQRCICDRKNILFVIVFGIILGINLVPPLLHSIVFGYIVGIQLAPPLFFSIILIWLGVAFPLCCQGRLQLGQGGHQMSLNNATKELNVRERAGVEYAMGDTALPCQVVAPNATCKMQEECCPRQGEWRVSTLLPRPPP